MTAPTKNVVDLATASTLAAADKVLMVDISDTTEGPLGTVKIATITSLSAFFDVISAQGLTSVNNNGLVYVNSGGALTSGAGLVFDGTNLGLGVTPSAWSFVDGSAFDLKNRGSLSSSSAVGTQLGRNCYYDGSWRYKATAEAVSYVQNDVSHQFFTAPSGTAGNAITFTEKARIDSDGLKFNGDTAAANALDDYEEGTWTPNLYSAAGGNPTFTSSGQYTKIGNLVTIIGKITLTSTDGSVGYYIDGFPFGVSSATAKQSAYATEVTTNHTMATIYANNTTLLMTKYDATFYGASGYEYRVCLQFTV